MRGTATPLNEEDAIFHRRLGAATVLIGPALASSTYSALVGFYVLHFGSRAFYVVMMMCITLPFMMVVFVQEKADSMFDRKFSTRNTFFFRIVFMHFVVSALAFIWMVMPQCPATVLAVGFCIGTFVGAISSSAMQLTAALDPNLLTFANLGLFVGFVSPVLLFVIFDFHPSASLATFQMVIVCVAVINALIGGSLCYAHFQLDIFAKAYERLGYDLGHDLVFSEVESDRQFTETEPLCPDSCREGVPVWVWIWCAILGILSAVKLCILSLTGFFGDAAMAQRLILIQQCTEFLGNFVAMPLGYVPEFREGPWHNVLGGIVFVSATFWCMLLAKLVGTAVARPAFIVSWGGMCFLWSFSVNFIQLTTGSYVKVMDRKLVARRAYLSLNVGFVLGLSAGLVIAYCLEDTTTTLPAWDLVIKK